MKASIENCDLAARHVVELVFFAGLAGACRPFLCAGYGKDL
jgi:hypothetical protein